MNDCECSRKTEKLKKKEIGMKIISSTRFYSRYVCKNVLLLHIKISPFFFNYICFTQISQQIELAEQKRLVKSFILRANSFDLQIASIIDAYPSEFIFALEGLFFRYIWQYL